MSEIVRCRFDHRDGTHTAAFELSEPTAQLTAWTASEVIGVLVEAEAAAQRGRYVAGFVAYDAAPAFDPAFVVPADPVCDNGTRLPLAWFGCFKSCAAAAPLSASSVPPGIWSCEIDASAHAAAVADIQAAIAAGHTYLVNFTTRFRRDLEPAEDPFALYRQLVSGYAGGYHAYLETTDWAVACGSPELFFELHGGRLTTRPMKGTAPRGRWAEEDVCRGEQLGSSAKERAENVMVVDLLRNDIGRIAVPGTVGVPQLWQVERHPAAWQLTSTVTAAVRSGTKLCDVFAALFPSGSVTGAPKVSSMARIAQLEHSARGVYCGAVGVVQPPSSANPGLRAQFAVAIRTAVVDKRRRRVEYGSGGGISWDSCPSAEWEEVAIKATTLVAASPIAPPVGLIETMGYRPGSSGVGGKVRNLDAHLARLAASAAYLGLPAPADAAGIIDAALSGWATPARVRLVLRPDGTIKVEVTELGPPDRRGTLQMLCIDPVAVASGDVALFHKTTDRSRYDERTSRHRGADDVVLVNERDEVTETTRANLAVRLNGRWWTPPLDCGLLPGIERGRLLASGRLRERVVTREQLLRADSVATLSSLRGWRAARVLGHCPDACRAGLRVFGC